MKGDDCTAAGDAPARSALVGALRVLSGVGPVLGAALANAASHPLAAADTLSWSTLLLAAAAFLLNVVRCLVHRAAGYHRNERIKVLARLELTLSAFCAVACANEAFFGTLSAGAATVALLVQAVGLGIVTLLVVNGAHEEGLPTGTAAARGFTLAGQSVGALLSAAGGLPGAKTLRRANRNAPPGQASHVAIAVGWMLCAALLMQAGVTAELVGTTGLEQVPVPVAAPAVVVPLPGRPAPTTTVESPRGDPPARPYAEICKDVKPGDGASTPAVARQIHDLILGPGGPGIVAGCVGRAKQVIDPFDRVDYATGTTEGKVVSVTTVSPRHGPAIVYANAADHVLARLHAGVAVAASPRTDVLPGDLHLLHEGGLTKALVRSTKTRNGKAAPYQRLENAEVAAWVEAMRQTATWLWPVPDGSGRHRAVAFVADLVRDEVLARAVCPALGTSCVLTVAGTTVVVPGGQTFTMAVFEAFAAAAGR